MKRKRDQSELEGEGFTPPAAVERVPQPDIEACVTCNGALTWDPDYVGTTCGGLDLVGGLVCACGAAYLSSARSKPAEVWKLAQSGTSLDAGGVRVRAERSGDVAALMARIVRVPVLEREVAALRAQLDEKIVAGGGLTSTHLRALLDFIDGEANIRGAIDTDVAAARSVLRAARDRSLRRLRDDA